MRSKDKKKVLSASKRFDHRADSAQSCRQMQFMPCLAGWDIPVRNNNIP